MSSARKKIGLKSNLWAGTTISRDTAHSTRHSYPEMVKHTMMMARGMMRRVHLDAQHLKGRGVLIGLFLGANRGTSCLVNTCHHRCFFVGKHAEGGP